MAELQARDATVADFRSRQVFALTAGAAAAVLAVLLLLPGAASVPVASSGVDSATGRGSPDGAVEPEPGARRRNRGSAAARAGSGTDVVLARASWSAARAVDGSCWRHRQDAAAVPAGRRDGLRWLATLSSTWRAWSARARCRRCSTARRISSMRPASFSGLPTPTAASSARSSLRDVRRQLVNRLGTIPRDAENATAAAFGTSLLQTVMADEISVRRDRRTLVTPGGYIGVMSAEVRHDSERQEAKLAAATIVAAQLATLVGPPSARPQARTAGAWNSSPVV